MSARHPILQFFSRRRAPLLIGAGAIVSVLTVGAIAQNLTQDVATEALKQEIEQRLGLGADIERLDLDLDATRLNGVRLTDPEGRFTVHVEQLGVGIDRAAFLADRDLSITHVEAVGVTVRAQWDPDPETGDTSDADEAEAGESEAESTLDTLLDGTLLAPWLEKLALYLDEDGSYTLREGDILLVHPRGELALHDVSAALEPRGPSKIAVTGAARIGDAPVAAHGTLELSLGEDGTRLAADFQNVPLTLASSLAPELPWHRPSESRISGTFVATPAAERSIDLQGRLRMRQLGIASPRLARDPIAGVDADLHLDANLSPAARRLELRASALEMEGVRMTLEGYIERGSDRTELDFRAELPETDCGAAVNAIPAAVLGPFDGFSAKGTLAGGVHLAVDTSDPDDAVLDFDIDDRCEFVTAPEAARLDRFAGAFVHQARAGGEVLYELETGPGTESWTPISRVSPFLIWAVLAHEDAAFFRHPGFAHWALETALRRNLKEGRFAYGGSTVSMQLSKNLFLGRDKTLTRKAREALLTWYLEKELTKAQILELYLNVIEYGPNVYGIRAASRHYFGREPIELSPAQSVFLATILPAPVKRHAQYESGHLWRGTASEMRFLLRRMHAKHWINDTALWHGLNETDRFNFHHEAEPRGDRPTYYMGRAKTLPFETELRSDENWMYVGFVPRPEPREGEEEDVQPAVDQVPPTQTSTTVSSLAPSTSASSSDATSQP